MSGFEIQAEASSNENISDPIAFYLETSFESSSQVSSAISNVKLRFGVQSEVRSQSDDVFEINNLKTINFDTPSFKVMLLES